MDNQLKEIKFDYETKFKSFRCKLASVNDVHFLNEPKILPCSNSACKQCILKLINQEDKTMKCKICDSGHIIDNIDDLTTDTEIQNQIQSSSEEIANELIEKLNRYVKEIKQSCENKEEVIEKLCEKVKKDIHDRIEAIKTHIDSLHLEMLKSLESVKQNVSIEIEKLNHQVEKKTEEFNEFSKNIDEMLQDFESNKEKLEKDMYSCQDYIEELKLLEDNFHKILRRVSFEPSEWMPDEAFVRDHIANFDLINSVLNNQSK